MRERTWLDRLSSILLALVLAVMAWLEANERSMPIDLAELPRGLDETIEIQFVEPPAGRAMYDPSARGVRLTLRGVRGNLPLVRTTDFEVLVDLSDAGTDSTTFEADVEVHCDVCGGRAVRVVAVEPRTVTVSFEPVLTRAFDVADPVEAVSQQACRTVEATLEPSRVRLTGPLSLMRTVDTIVVTVPELDVLRENREYPALDVTALDASGVRVDDLVAAPSAVAVSVSVTSEDTCAEAAVLPSYVGQVATGYYVTDLSVDPESVQLVGDPGAVVDLGGVVATMPVDITGAQADVEQRVALDLPPGLLALHGETEVFVSIQISPLPGTESFDVPVLTGGLDPALVATVSPSNIRVLVSGRRPVLSDMHAEDIGVTLDLTGLGPGTHRVTPRVELPVEAEGVRVRSTTPPEIVVTVTEREAGEPEAAGASGS